MMHLKPNTSYIVIKDFFLWGTYSGIELVKGQIISTEKEPAIDGVIEVECGPSIYVEVLIEGYFEPFLEELL